MTLYSWEIFPFLYFGGGGDGRGCAMPRITNDTFVNQMEKKLVEKRVSCSMNKTNILINTHTKSLAKLSDARFKHNNTLYTHTHAHTQQTFIFLFFCLFLAALRIVFSISENNGGAHLLTITHTHSYKCMFCLACNDVIKLCRNINCCKSIRCSRSLRRRRIYYICA